MGIDSILTGDRQISSRVACAQKRTLECSRHSRADTEAEHSGNVTLTIRMDAAVKLSWPGHGSLAQPPLRASGAACDACSATHGGACSSSSRRATDQIPVTETGEKVPISILRLVTKDQSILKIETICPEHSKIWKSLLNLYLAIASFLLSCKNGTFTTPGVPGYDCGGLFNGHQILDFARLVCDLAPRVPDRDRGQAPLSAQSFYAAKKSHERTPKYRANRVWTLSWNMRR